jgi:hypothetical protein
LTLHWHVPNVLALIDLILSRARYGLSPVLDVGNVSWYFGTAVIGLLVAAVLLRKAAPSVRWWEWPALAVPLLIWWILCSIPAVVDGRKSLAHLAELLYLGITVGVLGLFIRWLGARWLSPTAARVVFVCAGSVVAVLIALFVPILPE